MMKNTPVTTAAPDELRAQIFTGLATLADYAAAVGRSERTAWQWLRVGLPVRYIAGAPFVILAEAPAFWDSRRGLGRGRPSKQAAKAA